MKPPRACFLDYPLGNTVGIPKDADVVAQRAILRAALTSLPRFTAPGQIIDLPFAWPEAGWEQEVERTYRKEAHIVLDQRTRGEFDAEGRHFAKALAEEAAGYCKDCAL
ncbi:MAG: hypothetical protein JOY61_08055 [Chloroflexi bacterium]|nr:hypothetical protein [Chloroflexota bacterium]